MMLRWKHSSLFTYGKQPSSTHRNSTDNEQSSVSSQMNSGRVRTGFPSQLEGFPSSSSNVQLKKNNSLTKSNVTSTWTVGTAKTEQYLTEKHHHFINPKIRQGETQERPTIDFEIQRDRMRHAAVEKFEKLAKKKYGSVEGLFAAVSCLSLHLL
jgi:hypothetical protein